jgi:hypothetical protein
VDIDPEKYPGIAKLLELEQTDNIPEWAESSIARDFAERHKDDLRYVHEWGKWYRYHDGRWLADKTLYAYGKSAICVTRSPVVRKTGASPELHLREACTPLRSLRGQTEHSPRRRISGTRTTCC